MLEKFIYRNHMNEEVNFGQDGIFVNSNDLHDFLWNHTSKNNRISGFNTGIVKKTVPVVIQCNTEKEGIKIKNRLYEIAEKDVLALKHGKIIIGDYYLKCFITGSSKSDYLWNKKHMKASLSILTDFPVWMKETTTSFGNGGASQGNNLDFNRDHPFDYTSNLMGQSLNNTSFVPCNFRIVIYGVCENPEVVIAGHSYQVSASVGANEYLTIDSIEKTIVLTHADGSTENCFNLRNKESYIFEKIPVGESFLSESADFKFDVTLIEERQEPKWI